MLTVRLSHKLNDKVTLSSDTRYGVYSRYFQYSTLDQCAAACITALFDNNPGDRGVGGGGSSGGPSPYDQDAWGSRTSPRARMDYDLGSLKNQAIVGIDLSRQSNDELIYAYTLPPGFTTRPAIPRPLVNPTYDFPPGYAVFRACPRPEPQLPGHRQLRRGGSTARRRSPTLTAPRPTKTRGRLPADVASSSPIGCGSTRRLSVIGSYRDLRYHAEAGLAAVQRTPRPRIKANSTLKSPRVSVVFPSRPTAPTSTPRGAAPETPQGTSIVGSSARWPIATKDLEPEVSEDP